MALMENNNDIHNIRLLCILSGTTWDAHYFDTHNIVWVRRRSGDAQTIATNGLLADFIDKTRYVLVFDTKHNYSILTITCKFSCFHFFLISVVLSGRLKVFLSPGKVL